VGQFLRFSRNNVRTGADSAFLRTGKNWGFGEALVSLNNILFINYVISNNIIQIHKEIGKQANGLILIPLSKFSPG
jgi:hypothetical protein